MTADEEAAIEMIQTLRKHCVDSGLILLAIVGVPSEKSAYFNGNDFEPEFQDHLDKTVKPYFLRNS